ncbi:hypothetical protein R1flu_018975 [Riccia fluitans]|uniref:Uncharacterized protein n=1 Tax=Riccia fluitans TaxID=41844 RepID=A0ABD1ZHK8_9MARC
MDKAAWTSRAAVSNSPREQVISALGLNEFFELVVTGNECERPKPFPDPYLKALRFFGVTPEQALIFEDSPAGTMAGTAAGVAVVGLTTGHPEATLRAAGATLIINNYEYPALWERLRGETNDSAKNKQKIPDAVCQEPSALPKQEPEALSTGLSNITVKQVQTIPVTDGEIPLQSHAK